MSTGLLCSRLKRKEILSSAVCKVICYSFRVYNAQRDGKTQPPCTGVDYVMVFYQ